LIRASRQTSLLMPPFPVLTTQYNWGEAQGKEGKLGKKSCRRGGIGKTRHDSSQKVKDLKKSKRVEKSGLNKVKASKLRESEVS